MAEESTNIGEAVYIERFRHKYGDFVSVLRSHAIVRRPATALRGDPVDVLRGVLDVARLAVDAVLRVDLQPLATLVVGDKLVHAY